MEKGNHVNGSGTVIKEDILHKIKICGYNGLDFPSEWVSYKDNCFKMFI